MGEDWSLICSRHREDTLSYLTVKTAAVRCGLKPGELLRVPLCAPCRRPGGPNPESVLARLGLPYRVLERSATGLLAVFYHPAKLTEALRAPESQALLKRLGYTRTAGISEALDALAERWASGPAHEVGLFIGYPAADVEAFLENAPGAAREPGDRWRVAGDGTQSRRLMQLYRTAELLAADICSAVRGTTERFRRIGRFNATLLGQGA